MHKKDRKNATIENVVKEHAVTQSKKQFAIDTAATLAQISAEAHATDILGSYTGNPKDPDDPFPVQDADDL